MAKTVSKKTKKWKALLKIVDLLDQFVLLRSMQLHADAKGQFSATDGEIRRWCNEYIDANKVLNEEEQSLLQALARHNKITPRTIEGLLWQIQEGAGIKHMKMFAVLCTQPRKEQKAFLAEVEAAKALNALPQATVEQIAQQTA